jgi:hypothetical protein
MTTDDPWPRSSRGRRGPRSAAGRGPNPVQSWRGETRRVDAIPIKETAHHRGSRNGEKGAAATPGRLSCRRRCHGHPTNRERELLLKAGWRNWANRAAQGRPRKRRRWIRNHRAATRDRQQTSTRCGPTISAARDRLVHHTNRRTRTGTTSRHRSVSRSPPRHKRPPVARQEQ